MAQRFPPLRIGLTAMLFAIVTAAAPTAALAQDPQVAPARQKKPPEPGKLPKVGDKTKGLDFLFGALKVAPDDASARHVEAGSGRSGCRPRAIPRHC